MWAYSEALLQALLGDHELVVEVDVFTSAGVRAANVPIEDGIVRATFLSDVCREADLRVTRRLTDAGLFDTTRDRVRISTGPQGWPLIPIFTGRVQETVENDDGSVSVSCEDFGKDIVRANFEQPWQATPGIEPYLEMTRIIEDVDPAFGLDVSRALSGSTPVVTWDENRAQALDELAAAINCIWQPDRVGSFVLYPNPYALTSTPDVPFMLTDGPGGNITSFTKITTRDPVYNSITLLVERADNAPPIRVTVRDTDPSSPFLWGGEFGKQNRVIRLNTPGGVGATEFVARRILRQSLALGQSWRLSTPHFPLLDPGDIIGANRQGVPTVQVVESLTYPLLAVGSTTIATRELRNTVEGP